MTEGTLLDTNTVTLAEIFANGKVYRVPPYQRDYSWTEENWSDLWKDIDELDEGGRQHYMGAIVLQAAPDALIVIDGQQRLATLTILALAVLRRLRKLVEREVEAKENRERFDLLFQQYAGSKDPASLRSTSKLFLNSNDDGFFQQYLIQLLAPRNVRLLKDSERLLWRASEYFDTCLAERFPPDTGGDRLAHFLNTVVGRRLLFIQIRVKDELSAYTVFETLNARGLQLTETDLLKNYLFSLVAASETDLRQIRDKWQRLSDTVGSEELPAFLRHSLNSERENVRQSRLFKTLRDETRQREQVFPLVEALLEHADVYRALEDPFDEFWRDFPGASKQVRALVLFRVTQYKPLILACVRRLAPADVVNVLEACAVISFRFNVIARRGTHELEGGYNAVAVAVSARKVRNAGQVIRSLRSIYVSDEEFRGAFEQASISTTRRRKLAAYVLAALENEAAGSEMDFESSDATVEHVLPENPSESWNAEFPGDSQERFVERLGNLALLERELNRSLGSKPYAEKLPAYGRSKYVITNRIRSEVWSRETIDARQREMASRAVHIWAIPAFSTATTG